MHRVVCPTCGTNVELDFNPVSGVVWCPKCQKLFSPPATSDRESGEADRNGARHEHDGNGG
jgi:uncharacterized Zn finger protein (UPF0148 family)